MDNDSHKKPSKKIDSLFDLKPDKESLKFLIVYLSFGFAWILFSDSVLEWMIDDMQVIMKVQTYKGWLYVLVTGVIFYMIIRSKLIMIENNNQSLAASEQRYRLVVEGSNDGIWDWDLISGEYFFSIITKPIFGYTEDDFDNSMESWQSIYHPEDWSKTELYIRNFLTSNQVFYENTFRLRCNSGEYRWILSKGKLLRDKDNKPVRMTGSHTDITEKKLMEDKVNKLAYYDLLTQLPNRFRIEETCKEKITFYESGHRHEKFSFILIDIDNFKHINDTMGHKIGDQLVLHIKDILSNIVKPPDILARTGGDEFTLIVDETHNGDRTFHLMDDIMNEVRKPWFINDYDIFISVSAGIAFFS